eukprot:scaffold11151_cov194-Skeletonema_dohrnii-CCMP3373.AAC.1
MAPIQFSRAAKTKTCWGLDNASGLAQMTPQWRLSTQLGCVITAGYNYPVKVENNGQTLLDGPSCGGVREGLFPCSQKANACVENSYNYKKWQH